MGDIKHPGIQRALSDAVDILKAYTDLEATIGKGDFASLESVRAAGKMASGDKAGKQQAEMTAHLIDAIQDLASLVSVLAASLQATHAALHLIVEQMPASRSRH